MKYYKFLPLILSVFLPNASYALELEFGIARSIAKKDDIFKVDEYWLGTARISQEIYKNVLYLDCTHLSRVDTRSDYGMTHCGASVRIKLWAN